MCREDTTTAIICLYQEFKVTGKLPLVESRNVVVDMGDIVAMFFF